MAVLDAVKLDIYNVTLAEFLGARTLASLSENREPKRVLDAAWGAADGLPLYALERGDWNFATRTVRLDYDAGVEPAFGLHRAFPKPDDWRRTTAVAADERFTHPLEQARCVDEAGFWFSDLDEIFVRYVSGHDDFGMNSALWSEHFKRYLAAELASRTAERLSNSTSVREAALVEADRLIRAAKSRDAMDEGTKRPTTGAWVRARGAGRRGE